MREYVAVRVVAVLVAVAATSAGIGTSGVLAQRTVSCTLGLDAASTDLPIPSLTPPPGLVASGVVRGSNASRYRCGLRYDSTQPSSKIADHVNAQMTTMGWKPVARGGDASLVLTHYSGVSSGRDPLTAVATVAALDGATYHDVSVQIIRDEVPSDTRLAKPEPAGRAGGGGAAGLSGQAAVTTMLRGLLRAGLPAGPGSAYEERQSSPPGFPAEILPSGTDVRLAASSATHATVVGIAKALTVFEIPAHHVAVTRSGWSGRAPIGGFSLRETGPNLRPIDICRGTETAQVEFTPLEDTPIGGAGFAVRASHTRESKVACDVSAMRLRGFADVAIPLLVPSGVAATDASAAGNADAYDSEMRVLARVAPAAIVKELTTQLVQGGWTIVLQTSAGEVTAVRARNTSAAGEPVTALVVVTPLGSPSRLNLWLHVVRHKPVTPQRGGNP